MTQRLLESEGVQLALREIAAAREHLRLAGEVLSAFDAVEAVEEAVAEEARQLEPGEPPPDLLDIAHAVIQQVFPERLAQRARQDGTTARDWLNRRQCRVLRAQGHCRTGGDACRDAGSGQVRACAISCCCKPRRGWAWRIKPGFRASISSWKPSYPR